MSKSRANAETLRTALVAGDVTNANFTGADLELGKGGTGASTAGAARTALGVAIGSDVLAPDGSAANLTNLPAGGAEDFVASGTLPNGKPVILKANGQVEVVAPTTVAQDIPSSSEYVFHAVLMNDVRTEFDPNTANKFVVAYGGNSEGTGKAVVGTVSGNSISFGTEVQFNTGYTTDPSISFDPNTANKFIIAFSDGGNSYYGKVVVGTVSGTSISFGSEIVFNSATTLAVTASFDPNTANKFVVAYRDGGNSSYGTARVGTVSGNSISFGSEIVYNSATSNNNSISFDSNTANKFVVAYRDDGNSGYGAAIVGTVSGASISFGSEVVFNSGSTSSTSLSFDPNTANKFVVAYMDIANSSYGTAIVGTVSGTSISYGSEIVFSSANTELTVVAFDPSNVGKLAIVYSDYGNSQYGTVIVGTLSGNSISFGTKIVYNAGAVAKQSISFDSNVSGKFVIAYKDGGNNSYGTSILGNLAITSTNLTSTNFLGTSTAAYTNGQTAKIMLQGGVSTNQSSLAIGSTYYVQPNGTLATSASNPSVIAGKAVKANTLLLKGI